MRSTRPTEPGEEQVAGKELAVVVERDVGGGVPGNVDDVERDARDRHLVPLGDRVRRVVGWHAHAAAGLTGPERVRLARGRPDLCPGSLGEGCDAADVVDVGVGDEDPARPRAEPRELEPKRRRIVARIDHHGLCRAGLTADDVAVRLERPHHEGVDDERHASGIESSAPFRASRRPHIGRRQRFGLSALAAPLRRR